VYVFTNHPGAASPTASTWLHRVLFSWFGGVNRTQIPGEMMAWVASDCQSGDGKMLFLRMPPRQTSRCQNRPSRCWPTRAAVAATDASIEWCVSTAIQVTAAARQRATTPQSRKMRRANKCMFVPLPTADWPLPGRKGKARPGKAGKMPGTPGHGALSLGGVSPMTDLLTRRPSMAAACQPPCPIVAAQHAPPMTPSSRPSRLRLPIDSHGQRRAAWNLHRCRFLAGC
jgi:hypothetical protein